MLEHAFSIKAITVGRRTTPIVLQNDVHCPLVAIANLFLLRGTKLGISICMKTISGTKLLDAIASHLLSCDIEGQESEFAVAETLNILHEFKRKIDMDFYLTGTRQFHETTHFRVFELLKLNLYHGCLVDPNTALGKVASQYTHQQAHGLVSMSHYLKSTHGKNLSVSSYDKERIIRDATEIEPLIKQIELTNQMTEFGLQMLHEDIKDSQLAVLYSNKCFQTVCKYQGKLYILCTKQGLDPSIVWTRLTLKKEPRYYRGDFTRYVEEHHVVDRFLLTQREIMYMNTAQLKETKEKLGKSLKLIKELETKSEQLMCVVCFEQKKNIVFIPCKHCTCCEQCSVQIDSCPMCRTDIKERMEIFM